MRNLYLQLSDDVFSQTALAVVVFCMDLYHRPLDVVHIDSPSTIPFDRISRDTRVFVVGFTPPIAVFEHVLNVAGDVIWVDDNAMRVDELTAASTSAYPFAELKGRRDKDLAPCELMWKSYFTWTHDTPQVIRLVGRYQMQDKSSPDWETRIVPFYRGLVKRSIDPLDSQIFQGLWKVILCLKRDPAAEDRVIEEIIAQGREC